MERLDQRDMPVSAEILQQLINDRELTAEQMCNLLGFSGSAIYRRISGEVELSYRELRVLMRNGGAAVVMRFITDLVSSAGIVITEVPASMDINGDGDVNTDDLLDGCFKELRQLADQSNAVRRAVKQKKISARRQELKEQFRQLITTAQLMDQLVDFFADHEPKRKRCRPVVAGGAA